MSDIEDLRAVRLPQDAAKEDGEAIETRKVIILGDSGVGKSAILNRLTHDRFETDHNCTIGVEFGSLGVRVEDTRMKL